MFSLIGLIILAVIVAGLLWMSMAVVPEGMHYTVELFGRFRRTLTPGRRLVLPFAERIVHRVDMQETLLVLPPQAAVTADGRQVTVHANVQYQVLDAARAMYQVADHRQALTALTAEKLRQAAAALPLAVLRTQQRTLAERLRTEIEAESIHWGIAVLQLDIADVTEDAS